MSIDDPAFLFENNEGFHEVLSKKMLKSKQKAAAAVEESEKKAEQLSKKRESARDKVRLWVTLAARQLVAGGVCFHIFSLILVPLCYFNFSRLMFCSSKEDESLLVRG